LGVVNVARNTALAGTVPSPAAGRSVIGADTTFAASKPTTSARPKLANQIVLIMCEPTSIVSAGVAFSQTQSTGLNQH